MNNNDNTNEGIGIFAIIIIILLAIVGLYFFFSHRPISASPATDESKIPLEAPAPVHNGTGSTNR